MKKVLSIAIALAALGAIGTPALAGKAPKPYKSDTGTIAAPHTLLLSSTGQPNSVTINEFQNRCAIPASNGLDAYVYEVPAAYQKISANITSHGKAQVAWDLYILFFDKSCKLTGSIAAQGSVTQADASGLMPAGTAYVAIADFAGDPASVYYELKPAK